MFKVSPSGIGFLLECPRCLWLYVNEQIKRPRGIFPSLPSGMDEILKNYFDSYRVRGKLPPEIDGKVKGYLFTDMKKLRPWREIDFGRGGLTYDFKEFKIKLRGAIDELLINDAGEFVVFDFKTRGYPTKDDTHEHYQHQLDLYALLFEKNNYKSASYGYLLFFWPRKYKSGGVEFDTNLIEMKISSENGIKILKKVHEIVTASKPKAHAKCEYCFYNSALTKTFAE
jgi:CRISPR/Cas system-associated exonuclease Cas4 (RecB family)